MKIVILGGGFGGAYTAMALQKASRRRADIEVNLVDQKNYFAFQPMLAEVISGSVDILHTQSHRFEICAQEFPYKSATSNTLIWIAKRSR